MFLREKIPAIGIFHGRFFKVHPPDPKLITLTGFEDVTVYSNSTLRKPQPVGTFT